MVTVNAAGKKEEISADRIVYWKDLSRPIQKTLLVMDKGDAVDILETPSEFTRLYREYWFRKGRGRTGQCLVPPPGPCAAVPDLGDLKASGPTQVLPKGQHWLVFDLVGGGKYWSIPGEIASFTPEDYAHTASDVLHNTVFGGTRVFMKNGTTFFTTIGADRVAEMVLNKPKIQREEPTPEKFAAVGDAAEHANLTATHDRFQAEIEKLRADILQGFKDQHARREKWVMFQTRENNTLRLLAGEVVAMNPVPLGTIIILRGGYSVFVMHPMVYVREALFGPSADAIDPRD